MKVFILTALIFTVLAQTPHPVPIPGVNLTTLAGSWYLVEFYDYYQNANHSSDFTCYQMTFFMDSNNRGGSLQETIVFKNITFQNGANWEVRNNTSTSWIVNDGLLWDWVALDPVSQSWATIANTNRQVAFLLSRNTSISNLVLNAQIALLKTEGFGVNTTNILPYAQNACPTS